MIIVRLKGGMGNQMFQYALGRAISLRNNTDLGLDLTFITDRTPKINFTFREYGLDVFNIKADIIPENKIPFLFKTFKGILGQIIEGLKLILPAKGIERSFGFNKNILNISDGTYLDGYWQSPKYFEEIKDIIHQDFTFKENFSEKIEKLKEEITNCNSLCIHLRRGDYVGNKFHEVVNEEYYKKGLDEMSKLTKIDKIYVFSDDIKWCEENLKFDYPTIFVNDEYAGKKAEGHLYLMSCCKNFIIPNSTFAWWGAWLSESKDKKVIVPKQWFGIKAVKFDIIPEEWIKM